MAVPTTKLATSTSFRFELPAIPTQTDRLTDGTDIPPPPPSPPPAPQPASRSMPGTYPPSPLGLPPIDTRRASPAELVTSPISSVPPSPSVSTLSHATKRPLSVRKLLSLRSLSGQGARSSSLGTPTGTAGDDWGRPESPSPSVTSFRPSLRSKRSSLLWGRKRDGGERSVEERVEEEDRVLAQEKSSPPPRLPELKALGVDMEDVKREESSLLAEDMFKHIK